MMKNFIGFMTLQAGVAVISSLYTTMAIVSIIVNLFSLGPEAPIAWAVVILINMYAYGTWTVAMFGSYKESTFQIRVATTLWYIYICMWSIAVVASFFVEDGERYVCLNQRCPESLWLFKNKWHEVPSVHTFQSSYLLEYDGDVGEISVDDNAMMNSKPVITKDFQLLESKRLHTREADEGLVIGITLAFTLLTIYMFGSSLLTSYRKELECTDDCIGENIINTNV